MRTLGFIGAAEADNKVVRELSTRLCAWLLCAVLASAQTGGTFDPARDLDGFEALFKSELSDLYPVDKYSDLLGTEVTDAELAKLRAEWAKAKQAGDVEAARLRADPALLQIHVLRREIRGHKYLSKIDLVESADYAPCPLFIQKPAKIDEGYVAKTAAAHAPWLKKVRETFDERYAKPLGLERRTDYPLQPVAILASAGDFRNFWNWPGRDALYDNRLWLVVGHGDAFGVETSPIEARVRLLYSFVSALVEAHELTAGPAASLWFNFGFPPYLGYHTGLTPASLDRREIPAAALDKLVKTCIDQARRETLLFPIEELVGIRTIEQLTLLSSANAKRLSVQTPDENELSECFRAQAIVAMHFLQDARDEAGGAAFTKYFKARMSATSDHDAFYSAYDAHARTALDREFYEYVISEHARAFPGQGVDHRVAAGLFESKRSPVPVDVPIAADPAAPAPVVFDPAKLALGVDDVEAQHALALAQARRGELERARTRLAGISKSGDARIARELERIDALIQLRDGYFSSLASSGTKWVGEFEGKKLVAPIVKIDGGFLHLGENRQGVAKIPLAAVSLLEIAKQADKKEKQGTAPPWARSYAYLLAGEAKWDKAPKDASEGATALRGDAQVFYPRALEAAYAAESIEDLAHSALPTNATQVKTVLASIGRLLEKHRSVPLVAARMADLRELARLSLVASFGEVGVTGMVSGTIRSLEGGKIRVTYEFDNPTEANDFAAAPQVLRYMFDARAKDGHPTKPVTSKVEGGDLVLLGNGPWKHCLRFAGAVRIACEFRFEHLATDDVQNPWFHILLHGDGKESGILSNARGGLHVRDAKQDYSKQSISNESGLYLGTDYKLEIFGDGYRVTTFLDGEKQHEAAYGPRVAGIWGLLVHCETPLVIHRLEVEGVLDPAAEGELRSAWTARKLKELGFE